MLHGVLLPTLHGLRAEDHRPRSYAGLSAELAGEGRQRGWRLEGSTQVGNPKPDAL